MTKRLSTGVLLVAIAVLFTAMVANAVPKQGREWRGTEDPYAQGLPLFFRSQAGTTWVNVGQAGSPGCDASDTLNSTHSPNQVWCFEGAGGDSTWPAIGAQGAGTWDHWSKFKPPVTPASKWFLTTHRPLAGGGLNAWCGCTKAPEPLNAGCTDTAFWVVKDGYGDDWNYSLTLTLSGQNKTAGGQIKFDLRYDTECNYDYMYLEYQNITTAGIWAAVVDTSVAKKKAIFNAVSGNLSGIADTSQTGRACGTDIYGHSDQTTGGVNYNGNSQWLTGVTFPLPVSASGDLKLRWRCFSDGAWSDQGGEADTDGIGAIDNLRVTFTAVPADTVRDNFNAASTIPLFSPNLTVVGTGTATWTAGGLQGDTYDAWHMQFAPTYKNKGNTCTFSDDWMWSSKPAVGNITGKGFSYFLVSPKIKCTGWSGGAMEYSNYLCAPDERDDFQNTHVRVYNNVSGWSPWNDFDGYIIFGGCEFWNMNATEDLSPFLNAAVDSLQLGYEFLDISKPGEFAWGRHLNSIWVIDQVSVGSFDGTATQFGASSITIFADTFSLRDPAHTAQLANSEQGKWNGNGGSRVFERTDSLSVEIHDFNGMALAGTNNLTSGRVKLYWRVGTGTPPNFGAGTWTNKNVFFREQDVLGMPGNGFYETVIGNTTTEDNNTTPAGEAPIDLIWQAGQTVQYYMTARDDLNNLSTFPLNAPTTAAPFRFQVLPLGRELNAQHEKLLLVDDYTRNDLDFQNSTGFLPAGGAGFGAFTNAVFDQPEDMVERALMLLYGGDEDGTDPPVNGGPKWDIYNVFGAGSSVQCEPRVLGASNVGLGGITDDLGNPNYDAVIWLNGSFDAYSLADTTREELKTYLESGGNLLSCGQDVAKFLSGQNGGQDADSLVKFLQLYLGTEYLGDETAARVLNITGQASTSLAGLEFGLYGECNGLRKAYDRLTLVTTPVLVNSVLARYSDGAGGVNVGSDAAVIKNVTDGGAGGTGIQTGFDMGSMLTDNARACFLNAILTTDFGMFATGYTGCENDGVGAPVVSAGRFGFELAAAAPNPFADATSIRFAVPSRTHVSIEVYNILGQKVRTLVDEARDANSYVEQWDGRSDGGAQVSSGIYFYKMVAGDFSATKKAVLLK